MSKEFVKMISYLHEERFNMHLAKLVKNQTPCGIFFDFELTPIDAAQDVKNFRGISLNITCAIVLADVQAVALRKFVDIPVITLEDFSHFGEENFPVKPHEVFMHEFPYFADFLARYGIETIAPMSIAHQTEYFLFMAKHFSELYDVYNMLGNDESKKIFLAAIKGRLTGKMSNYIFAPEPQYFLEGFLPNAGDIAIDGGAFNADNTIFFAERGAKVFSFEMDAMHYKKCLARLANFDGLNVTMENLGLSDKTGEEHYTEGGAGSHRDSNGVLTSKFVDLDSYVAQKNLPRVDYIKLDIEGAELDMLRGAAQTIKRCKPKMAISVYHRWEDLFTLPLYIKYLRPDYEFEFRQYRVHYKEYLLTAEQSAVMEYFGLDYMIPCNNEMILYCR